MSILTSAFDMIGSASVSLLTGCARCGGDHGEFAICPSSVRFVGLTSLSLVTDCARCGGDHGEFAICPSSVQFAGLTSVSLLTGCARCGGDHGEFYACTGSIALMTSASVSALTRCVSCGRNHGEFDACTGYANLTFTSTMVSTVVSTVSENTLFAGRIAIEDPEIEGGLALPNEIRDQLASLEDELANLRASIDARGLSDLRMWEIAILRPLETLRWHTARKEFVEAARCLMREPEPDCSGAITHAPACLEIVSRSVSGRRKSLGSLLKHFFDELGLSDSYSVILHKRVWGTASRLGRHMEEGKSPTVKDARQVFQLTAAALEQMLA